MSQKARMIKRAPSRKQRQKARKKFGLYDETSASIELLPEGFLGPYIACTEKVYLYQMLRCMTRVPAIGGIW